MLTQVFGFLNGIKACCHSGGQSSRDGVEANIHAEKRAVESEIFTDIAL